MVLALIGVPVRYFNSSRYQLIMPLRNADAKALGVKISDNFLSLADEVIE